MRFLFQTCSQNRSGPVQKSALSFQHYMALDCLQANLESLHAASEDDVGQHWLSLL